MASGNNNISFDKLYSKYKSSLVRFAQSYLSADQMLAEDIVADAFTYFWEHRDQFTNEHDSPIGYIFQIVRTRCLNQLKKERKSVALTGNDTLLWEIDMKMAVLKSDNPEFVFVSEVESIINKAVNGLPEKTRTVFYMKKIHGKRYREIAETLNISEKTVEFHMSKALKALRKAMEDYLK